MRVMLTSVAVLLALTTIGFIWAEEEKVPLDKLPKGILEAVKKRFPKAEVVGAEKEKENGKTVFEIEIKDGGAKIEVSLTPEGVITGIEKQMAATDLPKAVTDALEAKYPKATFKIVEEVIKVKEGKDEPAYYEVLLLTADKKKLEVEVAADVKILKTEDKRNETEEKK